MKLRYTLPVRGMLRVRHQAPVDLGDWRFQFGTNKQSGYVDELVIEIADIPKERWPTIFEVAQDPNAKVTRFPFEVNEHVFRFGEIESYVINLESYLSVFGLEAIEFGRLKEEWFPENEDEDVSMLCAFSESRQPPEPPTTHLTNEDLARCIVASNTSEIETAALAHFRIGQMHIVNWRYIEAIRHLYLCLEYLFAGGESRKRQTLVAFEQSDEFKSVVSGLFFDSVHPSFERIKPKHPSLQNAVGPEGFFEFLVDLRGKIQHANRRTAKLWHPSREHEFEHEAICIMNVAEDICFRLTTERMAAVSTDG